MRVHDFGLSWLALNLVWGENWRTSKMASRALALLHTRGPERLWAALSLQESAREDVCKLSYARTRLWTFVTSFDPSVGRELGYLEYGVPRAYSTSHARSKEVMGCSLASGEY